MRGRENALSVLSAAISRPLRAAKLGEAYKIAPNRPTQVVPRRDCWPHRRSGKATRLTPGRTMGQQNSSQTGLEGASARQEPHTDPTKPSTNRAERAHDTQQTGARAVQKPSADLYPAEVPLKYTHVADRASSSTHRHHDR